MNKMDFTPTPKFIQQLNEIETRHVEAFILIKMFGDLAKLIKICGCDDREIYKDIANIIIDGAATYQLAHTQMFVVKQREE